VRRRLWVPAAVVDNSNTCSGAPNSRGLVLGEAAGGAEHVSPHHDMPPLPPRALNPRGDVALGCLSQRPCLRQAEAPGAAISAPYMFWTAVELCSGRRRWGVSRPRPCRCRRRPGAKTCGSGDGGRGRLDASSAGALWGSNLGWGSVGRARARRNRDAHDAAARTDVSLQGLVSSWPFYSLTGMTHPTGSPLRPQSKHGSKHGSSVKSDQTLKAVRAALRSACRAKRPRAQVDGRTAPAAYAERHKIRVVKISPAPQLRRQ